MTALDEFTYAAIGAVVDGVDRIAGEMERKWGVGRLRLLVPSELRERFDLQKTALDLAIFANDVDAVRRLGPAMERAWAALDRVATDAGARPLAPEHWECACPESGEVFAIVRTNPEAAALLREGRAMQVYTLDEVARLLAAFPGIAKAKATWPGATVEAVRRRPSLDEAAGDGLPF
jgi:hypothetical protein